MIAEYDNGATVGSPSREYVYGGVGLLAMLSGSSTAYFHQDHLGVRPTTDANGNVLSQQGTFPFGESWYQSGSSNNWIFTSYDRDSESGLDYALARSYDSGTGTFLMADPVAGNPGDPQSWNRYPYGRNNPINITDPSGESWWSKLLIGAGVAVASYFLTPIIDQWWVGLVYAGTGAEAVNHVAQNSKAGATDSPDMLGGESDSSTFSGDGPSSATYSSTLSFNAGGTSTSSAPYFSVSLYYNAGGTNSAQNNSFVSSAPNNSGHWYKPTTCGGKARLSFAEHAGVDALAAIPGFGTAVVATQIGLTVANTDWSDHSGSGKLSQGIAVGGGTAAFVGMIPSLVADGSKLAEGIPIIGVVAGVVSIGLDGYSAYKDYANCVMGVAP